MAPDSEQPATPRTHAAQPDPAPVPEPSAVPKPPAAKPAPAITQPAPAPAPELATPAPGFEEAFGRLEALVTELERGELPLERLLDRFEEGVQLVRHCQAFLKQAQLRVEQYVEQRDGRWVLKELDAE